MTDEEHLDDLLLTWEEGFERGEDIPAESLCRDRPDLAPALASRILALKKSVWMKAPVGGSEDVANSLSPNRKDSAGQDEQRSIPSLLAGRYRLDSVIAEGGFGQVWRGFDIELQRPVAVKVPRRSCLASHEPEQGFLAEARKVARLKHPGIVPVYDVGRHGESYFIVSELIDGADLGVWMRRGRLPVREAVRIVAAVADALDYAHRQGIIHRDIKPANVLLGADGQVRLTDLGIALDREAVSVTEGEVCGTLAYMSPEQVDGSQEQIDGRTDIYSLGVVFHELLTGSCPVPGTATVNLRGAAAWQHEPPNELPEWETPECLLRICQKCLSGRPEDRYATGQELADALRNAVVGLMTESDWLACTNPDQMLSHLYNLELDSALRKMRLFACACVRQSWASLVDERSRKAVEVAERYADGQATERELKTARKAAWEVGEGAHAEAAAIATNPSSWTAALETARLTARYMQCSLLHDLYGPLLFRTHPLDLSWLQHNGSAVRRLAAEIYEEEAFDRMGQLATALKEAGCEDEEMLAHCYKPGPHVRGCWVLDLLLGERSQASSQQVTGLGRTLEEREIVKRAMDVVRWRCGISKEEALRRLKRLACDKNLTLAQIAQTFVEAYSDTWESFVPE
jgi:serine/threonine protein kinase